MGLASLYQNILICLLCLDVEAIQIQNLTCSFDVDYCGVWNQVSSTWTREQYKYDHYPSTGPVGPKDGGFYIHIDPKINDTDSADAKLESDAITNNDNSVCLRFWYHMHGLSVQSLHVMVNNVQKFLADGSQGDIWKCGLIDMTRVKGKVSFIAKRDTAFNSIIALDGIRVIFANNCNQTNCETLEPNSTPSTASPTTMTTITSETPQTSTEDISNPEIGGIEDQIPIVVGVPMGVILVGGILVTVVIFHKRKQVKEAEQARRRSTQNNPYSGSPRGTMYETKEDVEVYTELDEDQMIDRGNNNGGYLDPAVEYDEPDNFIHIRQNGSVVYQNQPNDIKSTSNDDYIIPTSDGYIDGSVLRRSENGNIKGMTDSNMRPQSDDYLEPGSNTPPPSRRENGDYIKTDSTNEAINDDYLEPDYPLRVDK